MSNIRLTDELHDRDDWIGGEKYNNGKTSIIDWATPIDTENCGLKFGFIANPSGAPESYELWRITTPWREDFD